MGHEVTHVEYKKAKLTEVESIILVTGDWGEVKKGGIRRLLKGKDDTDK